MNIWLHNILCDLFIILGKKVGPAFWHYHVIRIWAMSDPVSRFLVIFYPLSPCTLPPFKNVFQHTLNLYVSLIMTLVCLDPCQWSLMSLITGNKVKKTHKPRYCEKEKPFYFDFHSARIIVDVSSGFYLWNIKKTTAWHL
jgi:hypothetical protein